MFLLLKITEKHFGSNIESFYRSRTKAEIVFLLSLDTHFQFIYPVDIGWLLKFWNETQGFVKKFWAFKVMPQFLEWTCNFCSEFYLVHKIFRLTLVNFLSFKLITFNWVNFLDYSVQLIMVWLFEQISEAQIRKKFSFEGKKVHEKKYKLLNVKLHCWSFIFVVTHSRLSTFFHGHLWIENFLNHSTCHAVMSRASLYPKTPFSSSNFSL